MSHKISLLRYLNPSEVTIIFTTMSNSDIIDGAYRRIHRRFNQEKYIWEEFTRSFTKSVPEDVMFNLIYKHSGRQREKLVTRVVEVRSRCLRETLSRCLRFVDTFPDDEE